MKRSDNVVTNTFLVTTQTSERSRLNFANRFSSGPSLLSRFERSATRVMTDAAPKAALKSSERAQFSLNYFSGQ
jgi:hypothetical protein